MNALSGCAIDNRGLAVAEVIRGNGALVVVTKTYGAALRTSAADAGLAIGYTRTLTVLPDFANAPRDGTYYFGISSPAQLPVAEIRRVVGLNIGMNYQMIGLQCGVSEDAIFARVPSTASVVRRLVLIPDNPALTELRICTKPELCK
jgi:hypothetical protein